MKEYTKLGYMNIVRPGNPNMLIPEQKQKLPKVVSLIKEKWWIKNKGWTFDDGSTQKDYIKREDTSPSTIYLELLMNIWWWTHKKVGMLKYLMSQEYI